VGHPDHLSIHAGGIVIAPGPLTDHVPLQWTPKGFLITQYPHEDVEEIGLPKMDLLGIRALTVLADAAALVREREDPAFDLDAIADGDLLTAEMLRAGATIGVFQCDSEGAQRTLRKLQASGVRDLAVANAFFKPGPSTGGMAPAFVRRYRGEEPPAYLHPSLGPILGNTKGVLIFQEQVLRVAREVAGLSWAQADRLRRGMSKFQPDEIAQLEQDFLLGCRRLPPTGPGLTEEQSVRLWKQVHAFSGYGFNQGHATAYAEVSYRSAYLKAHHPEAFFCARLADWGGYHHPAVYAAEAVRLGIPVRPPHVNHSLEQFSLSGKTLWMGLGQIRDLRHSTIAALVNARRDRPFLGLFDLIRRVAMHAKELDHLVRCGALDGLGLSRAEFLGQLESTGRHQDAEQLSFGFAEELPQPCEPESMAQRLAWETELLGWPVSVNPLEPLAGDLPGHQPLGTRPASPSGRTVVVGYRLPGWTGGPSFLFADGSTFITVERRGRRDAPRPWLPVALAGRWQEDPWGGQWFEAEEIRPLAPGL
jgi:DNA polymerase III alpha subunit